MSDKVYNFGAGPAMLPEPVMAKIQKEWLNYQGMGVSVIEISHRSKEFVAILEEAQSLFRELTGLPENYKILFIHGGARMQFSALPLNLAGRGAALGDHDFAEAQQVALRFEPRLLGETLIQGRLAHESLAQRDLTDSNVGIFFHALILTSFGVRS